MTLTQEELQQVIDAVNGDKGTVSESELAQFRRSEFYSNWSTRFAQLGNSGVIAIPNTTFDEWLWWFQNWAKTYSKNYNDFKELVNKTFEELNDDIATIDKDLLSLHEKDTEIEADYNYKIKNISAYAINIAPKPVDSLAVLQQKFPNGDNSVYVAIDNGHKYLWDATNKQWVDAGAYQSDAIGDHTIGGQQLAYSAVPSSMIVPGDINYDTTTRVLTINAGSNGVIYFSNTRVPLSGVYSVNNPLPDNYPAFKLVYNVVAKEFNIIDWLADVPVNSVDLGTSFISTDSLGEKHFKDNFVFNVKYDNNYRYEYPLLDKGKLLLNGATPNIDTARKIIEFKGSNRIGVITYNGIKWVDITDTYSVSYGATVSQAIILLFDIKNSVFIFDNADSVSKYYNNYNYSLISSIWVGDNPIADLSVKYTINNKLFNNVVTIEQMDQNDVLMLNSDNFDYQRSALSRGYKSYQVIRLENGSLDTNGVESDSNTNAVTPTTNYIAGTLINIGLFNFNASKFSWRIAEYDKDKNFIKFLTVFSTNANLNINLDVNNLYRLEIKTNDSSNIVLKEALANIKVVVSSNKTTVNFSILDQLIGQGQLVIAGNDRPYFYRESNSAIRVVLPNKQLYYYYGNGKTVVLPTSYLNQSFVLTSDNVLVWDLTTNSIIQQQIAVTRPFPSVILANNLYGNITNGFLSKWWNDQTKGIRGYKQNFQDKIAKRTVTGIDSFTAQGIMQVGDELWVGNQSTDDHSTDTIGQLYKLDKDLNKIGRFVHNLGHLNSMDYNVETDTMITSNTSDDTTMISEILLVQGITHLDVPEAWPLIDYNKNYVVKIPLNVNYVGGGPIFGENKNIVYFMAGNYYGTYKIQKYLLGTGSNNLTDFGTFISGKNDNEYNGTAKLLGEFYGPTMQVGQDATYFNGNIYGTFGRNSAKLYRIELNQANSTEVHGTYALKEGWILPNYDLNGNTIVAEAEGTTIWNGSYLRTTFLNKVMDVPIFNRQYGTGTTGTRVNFDFPLNYTPNISVTPTSENSGLFISQKDKNGFTVSSNNSQLVTFDWETTV